MAKARDLPMPILLLSLVATWATAVSARAQPPEVHVVFADGPLAFPPVANPSDPRIDECWSQLDKVAGCKAQVFDAYFNLTNHLSRDCCQAYDGLDQFCIRNLHYGPPPDFFPDIAVLYFCSLNGYLHADPPPSIAPTEGAPSSRHG